MNIDLARRTLAALCLAGATVSAAWAQAYPAKPIRIVVPFPAGGTSDILSRAIAPKLTDEWKQPVIIDNRPGASANIGAEIVVSMAPTSNPKSRSGRRW